MNVRQASQNDRCTKLRMRNFYLSCEYYLAHEVRIHLGSVTFVHLAQKNDCSFKNAEKVYL